MVTVALHCTISKTKQSILLTIFYIFHSHSNFPWTNTSLRNSDGITSNRGLLKVIPSDDDFVHGKLEWKRKNFNDTLSYFDTLPNRNRWTDRQTDRHRHLMTAYAMHSIRQVKATATILSLSLLKKNKK